MTSFLLLVVLTQQPGSNAGSGVPTQSSGGDFESDGSVPMTDAVELEDGTHIDSGGVDGGFVFRNQAETSSCSMTTPGANTCAAAGSWQYSGNLRLNDNIQLRFGTGSDYWNTFNGTSGRLELWSSDGDGVGTDELIYQVTDGTNDLKLLGNLNLDETAQGKVCLDDDCNEYIQAYSTAGWMRFYASGNLRLSITTSQIQPGTSINMGTHSLYSLSVLSFGQTPFSSSHSLGADDAGFHGSIEVEGNAYIDDGLIIVTQTTAPTLSSCGTSPSTVTGNDHSGYFTAGTSGPALTSCTLTFNNTFPNAPACTVSSDFTTSTRVGTSSTTTTTLVMVSDDMDSDTIHYNCGGL